MIPRRTSSVPSAQPPLLTADNCSEWDSLRGWHGGVGYEHLACNCPAHRPDPSNTLWTGHWCEWVSACVHNECNFMSMLLSSTRAWIVKGRAALLRNSRAHGSLRSIVVQLGASACVIISTAQPVFHLIAEQGSSISSGCTKADATRTRDSLRKAEDRPIRGRWSRR